MSPTRAGRHCAACQKVVIDFTQHTDAEMLAYFRQARPGQTCGRFRSEQLGRPLRQTVVPARSRWRAAVALLLAAWSTSQTEAAPRPVPAATHQEGPHRAAPRPAHRGARFVQGIVRDSVSGAPLAGVAVFLQGENRQASTDANGWFRLRLAPRRPRDGRALILHYTNYRSEKVRLPLTRRPVIYLALSLRPDEVAAAGVQVVGYEVVQHREITGGAAYAMESSETHPAPPSPPGWFRQLWRRLTHPFRSASPASAL